jgi:hypothetical protein
MTASLFGGTILLTLGMKGVGFLLGEHIGWWPAALIASVVSFGGYFIGGDSEEEQ